MKKIRQPASTPDAFRRFLEEAPADERTWDGLRNHWPKAYNDMLSALMEAQGGLCAYCEIGIKGTHDYQIEHFHPKSDTSDGHDWTFDTRNLFAACQGGTRRHQGPPRHERPTRQNLSCGEAKGDQVLDEAIIKPTEDPASPPIFECDSWGKLHVIEQNCLSTEQAQRARQTITELNLNCPRLCNARRAVYDEMREGFQENLKNVSEGLPVSEAEDLALDVQIDQLWPDARTGRLPAFFTAARSALGPQPAREAILAAEPETWL